MREPLLVADIGGTNARFAIARADADGVLLSGKQSLRVRDFDTPVAAARAYLQSISATPRNGAFAMAAPITDDRVEFTNSPWRLDIAAARKELGLERFIAVNDFEALATGVSALPKDAFIRVKNGLPKADAPVVVLGPGTGFGQALIVPQGDRRRVISAQGGHVGFAPQTEEEIEVLRFLARSARRICVEDLLSGPGLVNLHHALCAIGGADASSTEDMPPAPEGRGEVMGEDIVRAALTGASPIAKKTLGMFCAILGSVAGDAVLSTGALGGALLAGGILPRVQEPLLKSAFVERFCAKDRMRSYVEPVPVDLIVSDDAALLGAALVLMKR